MGTFNADTFTSSDYAVDSMVDPGSGIVPLDYLRTIRIHGPESESFLQSQFSSDVNSLQAGQQQLGAYCNPKGRALAVYRLLRDAEGFDLILPEDLSQSVFQRLKLYRMRAKVEMLLEDDTGVIGHLRKTPASGDAWKLDDDRSIELIRSDPVHTESIRNDGQNLPSDCWKLASILSLEPQIYKATTEAFIPQHLNLDLLGGISFRKGCYPGQEIIARIRYLGKIKQRMTVAKIVDDHLEVGPGDSLYLPSRPDQVAGKVVDAVRVEGAIWLSATVPVEVLDGSRICFGNENGVELTVLPAPYDISSDRN